MRTLQIIASGIVGFFMLLGVINIIQFAVEFNTTFGIIITCLLTCIILGYGYFMYHVFRKLDKKPVPAEDNTEAEKELDPSFLHAPHIAKPKASEKINSPVQVKASQKKADQPVQGGESKPIQSDQSVNRNIVEHENTQAEMQYNTNRTDGISDILMDFAPVAMDSYGYEHPVFDDEQYIQHFKGTPQVNENKEEQMVSEITEKVMNRVEGLFNKLPKDIMEQFKMLQDIHYNITDLKKELGIRDGEEIPVPKSDKETRLIELKEAIKEANILKDEINENQAKEKAKELENYSPSIRAS